MGKTKKSKKKRKLKITVEDISIVEFYANEKEEEIAKNLVELVKKKLGGDIKVLREN